MTLLHSSMMQPADRAARRLGSSRRRPLRAAIVVGLALGSVATTATALGAQTNTSHVAAPGVADDAQIGYAMAATRTIESGGNYQAQSRGSTASGAYQVIDSTWNTYAGYLRAGDAPPEVQDRFAYTEFTKILKRYNGDVSMIPLIWYFGSVPNLAQMDTVPYVSAGNVLTPRQYQTKWMTAFAGLSGQAAPPVSAATPVPSGGVLAVGARGDTVKQLQRALLGAGVTVPGGADGNFGPKTKSAVIAFQSRQGLAVTGQVDEATARALGLLVNESAAPGAVLAVGARGDAVRRLQQELISMGVYVAGGADGWFGPATRTAVTNFQRWNGLTVSGTVDEATAARLGSAGANSAQPADSGSSSFVGLRLGSRGGDVKVLQQALIGAGISVRGGADGWFGPVTQTALISYQRANGLSPTGVVGDSDATALGLGPASG